MKIHEYREMVKYLTRGPSQKSLAMQKDLKKNPNLSVDELVKRTQENKEFDKKHPPLISTKAMLENDLLNADDMLVQYDSATGLFTNKDKTIGFKDVTSARQHNQIYESYSPKVQKVQKELRSTANKTPVVTKSKPFVKPTVKPKVSTQPVKLKFEPLPKIEPIEETPEMKLAEAKFKKLMQDRRNEIVKRATSGLNSFKPASIQKEEIERSERTFNANKGEPYDL